MRVARVDILHQLHFFVLIFCRYKIINFPNLKMNKLNFVSCVSWIQKGAAKEIPNRLQMSKEDIQMKIDQNKQKLQQM